MYEIKQKWKTVDGITLPTWEREICDCNILKVEAGTTGYRGGDSGHGCRTYFKIKDDGSTDINVAVNADKYGRFESLEVATGGDAELRTMIQALEFIVRVLKEEAETDGIESLYS